MDYNRPFILFTAHLETIFPALLRKVKKLNFTRERIETPDDDFLDLDWIDNNSEYLIIISHGLEGSSDRPYMKGMAKAYSDNNFDVLSWNFRGCSEEINKQLRFYHSGATDDLDLVINHAQKKSYKAISLIGFSLGGNLTLKYLGEKTRKHIKRAVVFSVPLHLHSSCVKISESSNYLYSRRFLKNLKKKIMSKAEQMPDKLDIKGLKNIKTLKDFDDKYTAPIHGFKDAEDYYNACSSIYFLESIKTPTLIVNAANDPFLSDKCYPTKKVEGHDYVKLEVPKQGGHVGFADFDSKYYWSEQRALKFIKSGK